MESVPSIAAYSFMPSMSKLKIAILTTDTLHHRYFIRQIYREVSDHAEIVLNIFEARAYPWRQKMKRHFVRSLPNIWRGLILNPYFQPDTSNRIERYERPRFFPDGDTNINSNIQTHIVESANDVETQTLLKGATPDLILVYGTGLLKSATYSLSKLASINAHGGKIPGYRGLDTNLWAAYEGRPDEMMVTLHGVDKKLDTGPVYLACPIEPQADLSLISIRYYTTILCTKMFIDLIKMFSSGAPKPMIQDLTNSRYYNPMPWLLKLQTNRKLGVWARKCLGDQSGD